MLIHMHCGQKQIFIYQQSGKLMNIWKRFDSPAAQNKKEMQRLMSHSTG